MVSEYTIKQHSHHSSTAMQACLILQKNVWSNGLYEKYVLAPQISNMVPSLSTHNDQEKHSRLCNVQQWNSTLIYKEITSNTSSTENNFKLPFMK
jgi:hypothetical protein